MSGGPYGLFMDVARRGCRTVQPGMHVSPTTAALALLLIVLCVATFGRLWMAMAAAIAATLSLNFFILPPVGTFTIAEPENWVALFVFLVVAVIGSQLSAAAQARAREAARGALASTLLASLSHDLRTPLTAIGVAIGNLIETASEVERRQQAEVAVRELHRLNHVLEQILDMARIDAQAIATESQWVTAADIIDAAVAYAGQLLDAHELAVNVESDAAVLVDPRLTSSAGAPARKRGPVFAAAVAHRGARVRRRRWHSCERQRCGSRAAARRPRSPLRALRSRRRSTGGKRDGAGDCPGSAGRGARSDLGGKQGGWRRALLDRRSR